MSELVFQAPEGCWFPLKTPRSLSYSVIFFPSFPNRSLRTVAITNTNCSSFIGLRCHMLTHSSTWSKKKKRQQSKKTSFRGSLERPLSLTQQDCLGWRTACLIPTYFPPHTELTFSHCMWFSPCSADTKRSAFPQIFRVISCSLPVNPATFEGQHASSSQSILLFLSCCQFCFFWELADGSCLFRLMKM